MCNRAGIQYFTEKGFNDGIKILYKAISVGVIGGIADYGDVVGSAAGIEFPTEFGAIVNADVMRCAKDINLVVFEESGG